MYPRKEYIKFRLTTHEFFLINVIRHTVASTERLLNFIAHIHQVHHLILQVLKINGRVSIWNFRLITEKYIYIFVVYKHLCLASSRSSSFLSTLCLLTSELSSVKNESKRLVPGKIRNTSIWFSLKWLKDFHLLITWTILMVQIMRKCRHA